MANAAGGQQEGGGEDIERGGKVERVVSVCCSNFQVLTYVILLHSKMLNETCK